MKKENPNLEGFTRKVPLIFRKIREEVVWRVDRYKNDLSYPIQPEKLVTDVTNVFDKNDVESF